ncbi:hypothetical protein J6590_058678 [Homalodisca vitripennis]|nr:hypothetical protein J6590_058678 [Homalodisca vitripennis]
MNRLKTRMICSHSRQFSLETLLTLARDLANLNRCELRNMKRVTRGLMLLGVSWFEAEDKNDLFSLETLLTLARDLANLNCCELRNMKRVTRGLMLFGVSWFEAEDKNGLFASEIVHLRTRPYEPEPL